MDKPFVFLTLPLILGILSYSFIEINLIILLILLTILFLFYIFLLKTKIQTNIHIIFIIIILGMLVTHIKDNRSILKKFAGKNVGIEGTIVQEIDGKDHLNKYIVKAEKLGLENEKYNINEKLMLTVVGEEEIKNGDKIIFNGELRLPKENSNPKMFNYRRYLLSHNIYTISTIKDFSIVEIKREALPWYIEKKLNFIEKIQASFDKYLSRRNSLIMKSILLGDYSYMDEDMVNKYRELGLSHLMAVSGLHIGIISMFLTRCMGYAGLDRRINYIITITILWVYAYFIDFPPSIIRANIMFSILFYSHSVAERYDSINSLFFSMFICLVSNPYWIFDAGFQLSFTVTLSIIVLTPEIETSLYSYGSSISKSISAILTAQIGSLPIIAYYFNNISLVGILANLIIVPILSFCLVLGLIMLLFSLFSNVLVNSLAIILGFLLNIQGILVDYIYNLPLTSIILPSPKLEGIILYYFIVLCAFGIINLKNIPKEIQKVLIYYLVVFILFISITNLIFNPITINFVDVGQGDCAVIKKGGRVYLIDTGGSLFNDFTVAENIVFPYLIKHGIFKIDAVFISHFHLDHCESLIYLMERMKIGKIYISYEDTANELYNDVLAKAEKENIPVKKLVVGDRLDLGKDTYFKMISPDETILTREKHHDNNKSMVLLLNVNDRKILFTGDIEEETESYLSKNLNLTIDFLKVPHHGSDTSSTAGFVDAISPKYAFIQVGENNFGHPSKKVLETYKDQGTKVFRNDLDGHISLTIDRSNYTINPYNVEKFSIMELLILKAGITSINIICIIIVYIIMKNYITTIERLKGIDLQKIK